MRRTLRSGATFGAWDGSAITVVDPQFDLADLVRQSVDDERDEQSDEDNDYELCEASDTDWSTDAEEDASIHIPSAVRASGASSTLPHNRKRHNRQRSKAVRKRQRLSACSGADSDDLEPNVRLSARRKHVAAAEPIARNISLQNLRVTKTGYTAMRDAKSGKQKHRTYQLQDLVGPKSQYKFELYEWDGRKTVPLVDKEDRVFAVLAGCPDKAPDWGGSMQELADAIETTSSRLSLNPGQRRHRRGPFPATAHGYSFGGGQREPLNIAEKPANTAHF
ncbi:hypothetical protein BD626DRAFT_574753 [Schizophyllum amplum]|uniref:Uncharacterized protein n=1 Tax=Schizophyllum amplum TaxID=97359 RepID=A0A550BXA5_9AGAR|nr:hypothetical protein BD626DRAFT_574753 [Auriculariopsis ampla]